MAILQVKISSRGKNEKGDMSIWKDCLEVYPPHGWSKRIEIKAKTLKESIDDWRSSKLDRPKFRDRKGKVIKSKPYAFKLTLFAHSGGILRVMAARTYPYGEHKLDFSLKEIEKSLALLLSK